MRATKIGDKVKFIPAAWTQFSAANVLEQYGAQGEVVGEIIEINREHRWYRVQYQAGGTTQHETFKF